VNSEDAAALQREIHAGIPLSDAMGFEITELESTAIRVAAPLKPNINVHSMGFAGSLYALGILTGWGISRHLIRQRGLNAELVVAEASIRYRAPVRDDIECHCVVPGGAGR
jgi:thioesterase domain-containing protein